MMSILFPWELYAFLNIQSDKNKSRDRLSIPKDRTVLLFFGMIKKVKGTRNFVGIIKRCCTEESRCFIINRR